MRDLWIRLHVHSLLRGSYVFPGVELSTESLDFEPFGFVDAWRGEYHGVPVCIKAIRTQNKSTLEKIKKVPELLVRSELNSPHITPDLLPRSSRVQALFPSKCTARRSGFGGAVPLLYH